MNRMLTVLAVSFAALAAGCGVDGSTTGGSPDDPLAYTTRPRVVSAALVPFVTSDIRFTTIVERPDDEMLYALDQSGRVLRVPRPTLDDLPADPTRIEQLDRSDLDDIALDVVDATESRFEEGLLGLAFDVTGRTAYIHQSRKADAFSVIAEYTVNLDGHFDPASRRELLAVGQSGFNHNGGQLLFGPDGYLYIAFGDGSGSNDNEGNALDLSSPLGKILRIDPTPTGNAEYGIPTDNPFVDVPRADPRVWSLGLRNPFSFSFDALTGDMWVADVGASRFEEVNLSIATDGLNAGRGVDYGWSQWEATTPFRADRESLNHQPPRFFYAHADFADCGAVADGLVVRESQIELLNGWYTYGDWCSGLVWARDTLQLDAEPVVLGMMPGFTQMLQTSDGNLYASSQLGTIALVVPG